VGYLNYSGKIITNGARCAREIKSRIAMIKASFNRKKIFSTKKLDVNLRKKLVNCYICIIALYDGETRLLREVDQKSLGSFEMWCWRRMEEISWTDRVRNEEVLHRVKEKKNILHTIKRKASWIGHTLLRNCLLRHIIKGKV
jgi:replicative superfamily II helicase